MEYEFLTKEDQAKLLEDRQRDLERDHFVSSMEFKSLETRTDLGDEEKEAEKQRQADNIINIENRLAAVKSELHEMAKDTDPDAVEKATEKTTS